MKEFFPGYYKKNEKELKNMWDNGIILFDANVLLNLYRYSDTTRETILDLISKFSDKIYLPHQAALEYNRNRYEVIAEQEKAYKEFLFKISQIQQDLQSTNKPPFLSSSIDAKLNKVFENVNNEVEESIRKYCDFLKTDPIYERISILFKNKVTDEFSQEELEEIYKEGEKRYKNKVPPGFEDEKNKEGIRKYGDLVLWKQIIKLAQKLKKDFVLITDERKVDWWWKIKDGRNMGPRQELVEEIYKEAKINFHMYSSERFLSYGQTYLKEQINKKALEEIQAMKNAELDLLRKFDERNNKFHEKKEYIFYDDRISEINDIINNRDIGDKFLMEHTNSENLQESIINYNKYIQDLRHERDLLIEKREFENKHSYRKKFYNLMSESDKEILSKFIDISKKDEK